MHLHTATFLFPQFHSNIVPGGRSELKSQSMNLSRWSPGSWEPLALQVKKKKKKKKKCLASALAPPSPINQGRPVYETSIPSSCISQVSQWALQRKKRKHISVNIWLHTREPLDTAVTAPTVAFHRAKWKYTKVSLPTHRHPDTRTHKPSKLIGLNRLAH